MSLAASPRFLRHVMLADAASCAGTGALQVLLASPMSDLFNLHPTMLFGTGLFLLAYAAVAAFVGTREPIPRQLVALFAAGNVGWAVICIALLVNGAIAPTTLGTAWVFAQVVVVLVLAELQWLGLKRYPVTGWA
ncbi:hypothetical protein [Ramlibacter albus]|uniref:Uncharacterized protein n=1 Tax=Ramlibacter albus TaxID=2079448 RepID=A0A923MCG5_9BURK|nr:hypothetical protein [Ramlibacter albus]MBC5767440.1 hypothetical protein [Ramlibacter albus]